jgi:hypothetical protein
MQTKAIGSVMLRMLLCEAPGSEEARLTMPVGSGQEQAALPTDARVTQGQQKYLKVAAFLPSTWSLRRP